MTDQQKWIIANFNRHFNRGLWYTRLLLAGGFIAVGLLGGLL
jgi:hypothetical protein